MTVSGVGPPLQPSPVPRSRSGSHRWRCRRCPNPVRPWRRTRHRRDDEPPSLPRTLADIGATLRLIAGGPANPAAFRQARIASVSLREPVLRDHPDLLRQRRAPPRPRVHDDRRRRAHPLAPPARRRRHVPHRHRRARPEDPAGRRGRRHDAAGVHRRDRPAVRRGVAARSTSPTTTSSAPPSRATRPASPSCCSAATTPATSSSTCTPASTASRCEEYYTDDELLRRRPVPDPQAARSSTSRRRTTSSASSRFQDRLLDWYAAHPGAIVPEFRGNEALGLIRGGLRDFSVSRTSLEWGIPLPWDPKHVAYVWFDALDQLPRRRRLRRPTEQRLRRVVAGRLPPDRQGHHPPPLRVLAGDADVGRASSRPRAGPSAAGCSSAARR